MSDPISELPQVIRDEYTALRVLPDGRIIGVHRLMYHWTLHVDIDDVGYADKFCYATMGMALAGLELWDGTGDPPGGWHRHLKTGRRRNIETGEEWVQW